MNIDEHVITGDYSIMMKGYVVEGFRNGRSIYYETYGLKKKIGYDLQIVMSLHPTEVVRLLPEIIDNFKLVKIEDEKITNTLTNAPVMIKFMDSRNANRMDKDKLLRIIFSDEEFRLPHQKFCATGYNTQLEP